MARGMEPLQMRIIAAFGLARKSLGRVLGGIGRRGSGQQGQSFHSITEETLRRMDWLGFEDLVLELFRHLGFHARKNGAGTDGCVDIDLRDPDAAPGLGLRAVIQCRTAPTSGVGVDQARELLGVMAARKVSRGILVCNTSFTPEAIDFARANPTLQLADPHWLTRKIRKAPPSLREQWERRFNGRDYDVPSCPACRIKLVRRKERQGDAWRCENRSRGCLVRIPADGQAR